MIHDGKTAVKRGGGRFKGQGETNNGGAGAIPGLTRDPVICSGVGVWTHIHGARLCFYLAICSLEDLLKFFPVFYNSRNAENNCRQSEQLRSGAVVIPAEYYKKRPKQYCENGKCCF